MKKFVSEFRDSKIQVKVKCLRDTSIKEELIYASSFSVGLDLPACLDQPKITISPWTKVAIGTGLAIEIETPGIAGFVFSRSGLGTKTGLVVTQGVGVIDPDYRGEIIVSLLNISKREQTVSFGQRIAQLIFMPAYQAEISFVEDLRSTDRGSEGFGHSG